MKGILDIRKLFWFINSVLLIILVYIIVSFTRGEDTGKSTFVNSIPSKEKMEIIPLKNHLSPGNHEVIIERDIFESSGLSPTKENMQRKNTAAPTSVNKAQFRLLATVAGDDQVACAVIENVKSNVQDVYKAGDIIDGALIEKIDRNKIVLFNGKRREVLDLHIACKVLGHVEKNKEPVMAQKQKTAEFVNDVSPAERDISQQTHTTQVQGMGKFFEKMEVSPYIINGEEKGLCIAGLDDLSMVGYFGFENGDVIQTLNGQMLTGKQKAFQVLKKARSQSSLNFQLLRNQHKVDLSFDIK